MAANEYFLIFFFQAEDGIRDLTVTGVQTCALPIWSPNLSRPQARLADDLFALDPRIRYVALLDRNHKLVESRMRTSVASFTPESYDRKFMGSVPPLILDTLSQLEAQCVPLSHISVQYEKIDLILIPHNNRIIAINLEKGPLKPKLRKLRDNLVEPIHL